MTVSLDQAKAQLRVRHTDQNGYITDLIARAQTWIDRFVGEELDPQPADLDHASLILIEWWFYPDNKVELDETYNVPRAVVALALPFRTPTLI